MNKSFWVWFHFSMIFVLGLIYMFTIIKEDRKEENSISQSENKKDNCIGEMIVAFIIYFVVVIAICYVLLYLCFKNSVINIWFAGVFGIIYVYIAIKQIFKMIFIPENRAFSLTDIKDFIFTYLVWCVMAAFMTQVQFKIDFLEEMATPYRDMIRIIVFLAWYYFNIMFALGGIYIVLYYIWKIGNKLAVVSIVKNSKIKKIVSLIQNLWQNDGAYEGLKCFKIWKGNNGKCIVYNIIMTIPLLLFDIWEVVCMFMKYLIMMVIAYAVVLICDPIRLLQKYGSKVWNRHKNNEWMYIFAQIAGLCSYVVVFFIVQYGEYDEATKKLYEFAGTIILIPYFINKIAKVK